MKVKTIHLPSDTFRLTTAGVVEAFYETDTGYPPRRIPPGCLENVMGIYRVYLRGHNQRVSEKTVTQSPTVAETAFREMMKRRDLWCTPNAVVLSLDNRQLEFRRFDYVVPADPHYAELVKRKEPIPDYPRYLYPEDRELIDQHSETHHDDKYIICYFQKTYRGCPFIDDSRVRLFHDDPEF